MDRAVTMKDMIFACFMTAGFCVSLTLASFALTFKELAVVDSTAWCGVGLGQGRYQSYADCKIKR